MSSGPDLATAAIAAMPAMTADGVPSLGDAAFRRIAEIVGGEARIQLPPTKKTLVHSRLGRILRRLGLTSFDDYVALVEKDADERRQMITALTTNHTHFFREDHHFEHLRMQLLPQLKGDPKRRPVRIWSAGCSTGEEVYSIAMTLLGQDRAQAEWTRGRDVRLLATDLSEPVVRAVAEGWYAEAAVEPVPEAYRRLWMKADGAGWRVADTLREMVTARVLNLFEAWPMRQRYDAIFCRNVMIYFDDAAKEELTGRLAAMLRPGGFLYIGHSERLAGSAAKQLTGIGHTIYQLPEAA